jgi:hypothetical protein
LEQVVAPAEAWAKVPESLDLQQGRKPEVRPYRLTLWADVTF